MRKACAEKGRQPSLWARGCLFFYAVSTTLVLSLSGGYAQGQKLVPLPLDGVIANDGGQVVLGWQLPSGAAPGDAMISRRPMGAEGLDSWTILATVPAAQKRFSDETTDLGVAYEYRVQVRLPQAAYSGYWVTGREVPLDDPQTRKALLVVDKTVAKPLAAELELYAQDLVGDGWQVIRLDVPRGRDPKSTENLDAAREIRAWVRTQYEQAPDDDYALILIGRVPIVRSGMVKPDGHEARPHATDLFYAEMEGVWPQAGSGAGELRPGRIPTDHIEMPVGRIDFSRLDPMFGDEKSLLRDYFTRNHQWRHGALDVPVAAYAMDKNLRVEARSLINVVGREALSVGGHHDLGTSQPWLFGADFGHWNGKTYADGPTIKPVFAINFGSNKQAFERNTNAMRVLLAQSGYTLAVGWGGRPAWRLHLMGMGATIGEVQLRTANNGRASQGASGGLDYVPTGLYPWFNPIWVNLMGDPTLRAFGTPPVTGLRATRNEAGGIRLQWQGPETGNVRHYRVYSSANREGPYWPSGQAIPGTDISTDDPDAGPWFMVRASGLNTVHAGSFFTLSQGVFVEAPKE